ncbi:MAG TPA: glycosyltransferase [Vicinamibacterales bacterium]|nr:glycosyltransferase [Vicinamibacterales bacterium]
MRITVIGFGTRGDVSPLITLASRLRAAGHHPRVATHAEFEAPARSQGLDFHLIPGSYQALVSSAEGRHALGVPNNSPLGLTGLFQPFRDCAESVFREAHAASADAEAIVSSPLASLVATPLARSRDLPLVVASPIPPLGSRHQQAHAFPAWRLGPVYNRLTQVLSQALVAYGASQVFAAWRREAAAIAPPASARPARLVTLVGSSPVVVPRPPDWPTTTHVTGYWFPPRGNAPAASDDLRAFVEAGEPPICLGFGSMADDNPAELRAIVLDAVTRLRQRAVIVGGSGGALSNFDHPAIFETPFADYDWLFRRVSVVVHQGGAGTAAYCFTAGVPQVVVQYCLDHAFWAGRLHDLGVAPRSTTRSRLTGARLAEMIGRAVGDPCYRRRAADLAPRIAAEHGLELAARIVTAHLESRSRSGSGTSS